MLYGLDVNPERSVVLIADNFGYIYMYVCFEFDSDAKAYWQSMILLTYIEWTNLLH